MLAASAIRHQLRNLLGCMHCKACDATRGGCHKQCTDKFFAVIFTVLAGARSRERESERVGSVVEVCAMLARFPTSCQSPTPKYTKCIHPKQRLYIVLYFIWDGESWVHEKTQKGLKVIQI